ncbi:hypothetical protein ACKKBG_A25230 [Auxenochlorella protothecoides x Auxenochlorella symbiontica]
MEERLRAQVPTVAAAFRDSCQLASDSLFEAPGFAMPATPRDGQHPGQYIKYSQVESFLAMAEQALRARDRAVDALRDETAALMSDLDNLRGEKSKVEVAESVAVEEAQQLSSLVQQLHAEKAAMQAAMQKLQRESQYLTDENALLRNQLTMAMNEQASGDMDQNVSPLGPHTALIAHLTDTLSVEQDRATQVENENMLLRARVAALEKAGLVRRGPGGARGVRGGAVLARASEPSTVHLAGATEPFRNPPPPSHPRPPHSQSPLPSFRPSRARWSAASRRGSAACWPVGAARPCRPRPSSRPRTGAARTRRRTAPGRRRRAPRAAAGGSARPWRAASALGSGLCPLGPPCRPGPREDRGAGAARTSDHTGWSRPGPARRQHAGPSLRDWREAAGDVRKRLAGPTLPPLHDCRAGHAGAMTMCRQRAPLPHSVSFHPDHRPDLLLETLRP